jgi:hypothetical protein
VEGNVNPIIDYIENDPEWCRRMANVGPTIFGIKWDHEFHPEACGIECRELVRLVNYDARELCRDLSFKRFTKSGNHRGRAI